MVSNSNPGTCAEFITKLERFLDAKSVLQEYPRADTADMVQRARKNLMEFVEKHFELK